MDLLQTPDGDLFLGFLCRDRFDQDLGAGGGRRISDARNLAVSFKT
jgi:hypothetical protein